MRQRTLFSMQRTRPNNKWAVDRSFVDACKVALTPEQYNEVIAYTSDTRLEAALTRDTYLHKMSERRKELKEGEREGSREPLPPPPSGGTTRHGTKAPPPLPVSEPRF